MKRLMYFILQRQDKNMRFWQKFVLSLSCLLGFEKICLVFVLSFGAGTNVCLVFVLSRNPGTKGVCLVFVLSTEITSITIKFQAIKLGVAIKLAINFGYFI